MLHNRLCVLTLLLALLVPLGSVLAGGSGKDDEKPPARHDPVYDLHPPAFLPPRIRDMLGPTTPGEEPVQKQPFVSVSRDFRRIRTWVSDGGDKAALKELVPKLSKPMQAEAQKIASGRSSQFRQQMQMLDLAYENRPKNRWYRHTNGTRPYADAMRTVIQQKASTHTDFRWLHDYLGGKGSAFRDTVGKDVVARLALKATPATVGKLTGSTNLARQVQWVETFCETTRADPAGRNALLSKIGLNGATKHTEVASILKRMTFETSEQSLKARQALAEKGMQLNAASGKTPAQQVRFAQTLSRVPGDASPEVKDAAAKFRDRLIMDQVVKKAKTSSGLDAAVKGIKDNALKLEAGKRGLELAQAEAAAKAGKRGVAYKTGLDLIKKYMPKPSAERDQVVKKYMMKHGDSLPKVDAAEKLLTKNQAAAKPKASGTTPTAKAEPMGKAGKPLRLMGMLQRMYKGKKMGSGREFIRKSTTKLSGTANTLLTIMMMNAASQYYYSGSVDMGAAVSATLDSPEVWSGLAGAAAFKKMSGKVHPMKMMRLHRALLTSSIAKKSFMSKLAGMKGNIFAMVGFQVVASYIEAAAEGVDKDDGRLTMSDIMADGDKRGKFMGNLAKIVINPVAHGRILVSCFKDKLLTGEFIGMTLGFAAGLKVGAIAGAYAGAKVGALVGTAGGPVGTIVGGAVGLACGVIGGVIGSVVGSKVDKFIAEQRYKSALKGFKKLVEADYSDAFGKNRTMAGVRKLWNAGEKIEKGMKKLTELREKVLEKRVRDYAAALNQYNDAKGDKRAKKKAKLDEAMKAIEDLYLDHIDILKTAINKKRVPLGQDFFIEEENNLVAELTMLKSQLSQLGTAAVGKVEKKVDPKQARDWKSRAGDFIRGKDKDKKEKRREETANPTDEEKPAYSDDGGYEHSGSEEDDGRDSLRPNYGTIERGI